MNNTVSQFIHARKCSTPVMGITSSDPAATIASLHDALGKSVPQVQWDILRGYSPINKAGEAALSKVQASDYPLKNPDEALTAAIAFTSGTVIYFHGANALFSNDLAGAANVQGLWNLRDPFKSDQRCIVLLDITLSLPSRIEGDILLIDEPLPTECDLRAILEQAIKDAQTALPDFPVPDEETIAHAVDALRGLSAYTAEQSTVMSLTQNGLDLSTLWQRKREKIKQTPGLSVWNGNETYETVGGCDAVKDFLSRLISGPAAPRCIVFIDEIEKAMAGATGGDTSGVSQEMHGTLLSWMQDNNAIGTLFLGLPGAAKSAIAKATGNEAGLLEIVFDLSAMKGSLVGESNANLRRALKVVEAVSDSQPMLIATCNSIASLSPELRRRFTCGTFFFDLPTAEERAKIWMIYSNKYNVVLPNSLDFDDGWTGAEIKQCCEFAWRLSISITEAAQYIVPVSVSAAEKIEALRIEASGRYLAANAKGVYKHEAAEKAQGQPNSLQAMNRRMLHLTD